MSSNLEIAQSVTLKPITEIAQKLNLDLDDLDLYGRYKAKISLSVLEKLQAQNAPTGKLILVTAITPTPAGEGKTTVTIGLSQGLNRIGKRAISATREPAMGPVFGIKGGAAGGGYSQALPMEDINLHFTGDMHAISAAHNLLAAMLDNSLHFGNPLKLDTRSITYKRVLDMNDRALRETVIGLGGKPNGVPRETGFAITPASEVMAILCLSRSLMDLKEKLGRIVVGTNLDGQVVTAADLKANGAMTAVLKEAIKPNLAQTVEGDPALIHGGPFGNIAHGTSTILATQLGLRLADYVVTEAGFGSDLGGEKFCNLVCPQAGFEPSAIVVVATVRALKMHGGVALDDLKTPDAGAVERGFANLERHLRHMKQYGPPVIVAINRFASDTEEEIEAILSGCRSLDTLAASANVYGEGGKGAATLAEMVAQAADSPSSFAPLYTNETPLREKLNALAQKVYGGAGVALDDTAQKQEKWLGKHGFDQLPVCMVKTQYSLSDDPTRLNAPTDFEIHLRDFTVSAGAGFIVGYSGALMTMPGLPKRPSAEMIDIDERGQITGLF